MTIYETIEYLKKEEEGKAYFNSSFRGSRALFKKAFPNVKIVRDWQNADFIVLGDGHWRPTLNLSKMYNPTLGWNPPPNYEKSPYDWEYLVAKRDWEQNTYSKIRKKIVDKLKRVRLCDLLEDPVEGFDKTPESLLNLTNLLSSSDKEMVSLGFELLKSNFSFKTEKDKILYVISGVTPYNLYFLRYRRKNRPFFSELVKTFPIIQFRF
jgi:hypothetical protein